jgi:hypothetical protein
MKLPSSNELCAMLENIILNINASACSKNRFLFLFEEKKKQIFALPLIFFSVVRDGHGK